MTPGELVEAVQASGATVEVFADGRAKMIGELPPALLEQIKAAREEFIAAWRDEAWSRIGRVPSVPLVMRREPPRWKQADYVRVERYSRKQGDLVCQWVFHRAVAYQEAGMDAGEATRSALADLLHWQNPHWPKPEWQLGVFEEVAQMKGVEA